MYMFVSLPWGNHFCSRIRSGTFTSRDEGDKFYTAKVPVDIEAGKQNQFSSPGKQNTDFQKGDYKIEIYHNGFKIGEGTRTLKKGGIFG